MRVKAVSKYIRISPRKARLVANVIRGKKVMTAFDILKFTPKVGAKLVSKTLQSALANAEHNSQLNKEDLTIAAIMVDEGPILKRFRPVAKGASHPINKKTSHICITLDDGKTEEKKSEKEIKEKVKIEGRNLKDKKVVAKTLEPSHAKASENEAKESHGSQG